MDEIFKNNSYRILELFIELPNQEFSLRGIARKLNLSHSTILKLIFNLTRADLVRKKEGVLYPIYYANIENQIYKLYKKEWMILKIINSGLIEYIQKHTLASSIILFGSSSKATFTRQSDIDIFVESKSSSLNLKKYKKILGKDINLLFEQNINDLSKELKNNIINGSVLYGFIRIR